MQEEYLERKKRSISFNSYVSSFLFFPYNKSKIVSTVKLHILRVSQGI